MYTIRMFLIGCCVLFWHVEVPSAPILTQVKPYSSTAEVLFDEPESSGGVPVLKYRAEWRAAVKKQWVQKVYDVREGMSSALYIDTTLYCLN